MMLTQSFGFLGLQVYKKIHQIWKLWCVLFRSYYKNVIAQLIKNLVQKHEDMIKDQRLPNLVFKRNMFPIFEVQIKL